MSKKIIMACMALVAFAALALPAAALAANEPEVVENGTKVATGTALVGTATNTLFTTTEGATLVTCSTAKMSGTLKTNSGTKVEGEIPVGSAIFQGTGAVSAHNGLPECTGSFGNAYITVTTALCVRSDNTMVADEFQVNGGACGTGGKVKFIIGSTTAGACEYESTGAVKGDYTTSATNSSLTTRDNSTGSGSKKIAGGVLCPTSGALAMTFNLETSNGTTLGIQ
jgi:hypothetical protein